MDNSTKLEEILTQKKGPVTDNFCKDLGIVAAKVIDVLKSDDGIAILHKHFFELEELGNGGFYRCLRSAIEEAYPHQELCEESIRFLAEPIQFLHSDVKGVNDYAWFLLRRFLYIAIDDVYFLLCIHKNYGINKQKLIGLAYKNMRYGDGTIASIAGRGGIVAVAYSGEGLVQRIGECSKGVKLEKKDISQLNESHNGYKTQTQCPFDYTKERTGWVESIWDILETEVLPILESNFQSSKNNVERFYSGNVI